MNHKEKQSITHYISIRFAAIILIMAAIMILFISYFSNKTIYFDIRGQIRRESRYDFLNVEVRNGKILVDKNFIFRENHVQKLVLDSQGRTIRGHYPDKELNNYTSYLYYPNFYECKVTTNLNLTKPHHAIS